jgi:DNA-binding transcriptional ArsR family regulator
MLCVPSVYRFGFWTLISRMGVTAVTEKTMSPTYATLVVANLRKSAGIGKGNVGMNHPMKEASCELLGDFFATLSHATRMRIFCALQREAKTVTEIADEAGIAITNASQHLRLMRDRGAVIAEKRAQSVYYRIADPRFVQAAILIRDALSQRFRESAVQASASAPRRKQ